MRSPGLGTGTEVMQPSEPGAGPLGPIELRQAVPFEPSQASDELGWVGLEAARYRAAPASEITLSTAAFAWRPVRCLAGTGNGRTITNYTVRVRDDGRGA